MTDAQLLADFDHALRTMVVAAVPDPSLPEWQNKAYLTIVALPRAKAAVEAYEKAYPRPVLLGPLT